MDFTFRCNTHETIVEIRSYRLCVEHRQLGIAIDTEPILCIVNIDQILDELLIRLSADVAAFSLARAEHFVIIQWIVHDGIA